MGAPSRDVSGGREVAEALVPGFGFFNYVLGLFSVPIETFLRRDFGERYYSWGSFVGGVVILYIFRFVASIANFFNPLTWFSGEEQTESLMGPITTLYMVIGMAHFLTIKGRDSMNIPLHSRESGVSWLNGLGEVLMNFLNKVLEKAILILANFLPEKLKARLLQSLPLLDNVTKFTERFVEPAVVFLGAIIAFKFGQTGVGCWLIISCAALNFSTGIRHAAQRSYVLDIRDQVIEAREWQLLMTGVHLNKSSFRAQMVKQTADEVERNPEIINIIQHDNPTVAKAVSARLARQAKLHNQQASNLEAA